jgi:hypothetical protein
MKKVLLSVFMSVGIVVGAFGVAYALGTFNAIQQGFRPGGEGQAARVTMTVEAGTADGNSAFLPDDPSCNPGGAAANTCPGGALSFAITNTSDFPIHVTGVQIASQPCSLGQCPEAISSNKNGANGGSFVPYGGSGDCGTNVSLTLPQSFNNWPTIGPHSTLQVNGTDENHLGAGMIHMNNNTPQGCQGALFMVPLTITAVEVSQAGPAPSLVP